MDMDPQDLCDAGLSLGLAIGPGPATSTASTAEHSRRRQHPRESASLTLSLGAAADDVLRAMQSTVGTAEKEGRPLASPCSAVSSFSSASAAAAYVKKEKDVEEAEAEAERVSNNCRASDEEEDNSCCRKKLRLTKEQSALLEDRFKEHSTLNPVRINR